jgi:hypothetical protein
MAEITDENMGELLSQTKGYTGLLLKKGPKYDTENAGAIIMEHGRRNLSLREDGLLSIVCPIIDDTEMAGMGIFNVSLDQVKEIYDEDPAVMAGVLTYEVHPLTSFPGDCLPQTEQLPPSRT